MSLPHSPSKAEIVKEAHDLGFYKIGFAQVQSVDAVATRQYADWIASGCHGEMSYLERYLELREDPHLLLPSAKTIIVCAASYYTGVRQTPDKPQIATYALGRDYHEVLRERLMRLSEFIGGETRVCVDTAPVRERYWAVRAGVGFIGRNSQLIIPDAGSYFFLGEILTSLIFEPDEPCSQSCLNCGVCVSACPGGAIMENRAIDARRCLSYLTIEYRGELPEDVTLGNRIYGCDVCQTVCPHNEKPITAVIEDFKPTDELLALDRDAFATMTQEQFSVLFRHSAIKRTKLSGLQRNLSALDR